MDEPSAGVDVELKQNLWNNVKDLNRNGVTIILTTHYLHEAEEMCDRIAIINNGSLVALDSTENLLKRIKTKIVKFTLDKKIEIKNDSLTSLKLINYDENILTISYEKSKININEVISFINMKKANIIDMSTDDGKLEDVFIRLTNS